MKYAIALALPLLLFAAFCWGISDDIKFSKNTTTHIAKSDDGLPLHFSQPREQQFRCAITISPRGDIDTIIGNTVVSTIRWNPVSGRYHGSTKNALNDLAQCLQMSVSWRQPRR